MDKAVTYSSVISPVCLGSPSSNADQFADKQAAVMGWGNLQQGIKQMKTSQSITSDDALLMFRWKSSGCPPASDTSNHYQRQMQGFISRSFDDYALRYCSRQRRVQRTFDSYFIEWQEKRNYIIMFYQLGWQRWPVSCSIGLGNLDTSWNRQLWTRWWYKIVLVKTSSH